ncbi:hypothetical protein L7F22_030295 [Adiantum nelumboides]|nr:hypothetical protein [Adiantum nelumboides]
MVIPSKTVQGGAGLLWKRLAGWDSTTCCRAAQGAQDEASSKVAGYAGRALRDSRGDTRAALGAVNWSRDSHWAATNSARHRVEEMSTFVTPWSYTLAIADAPYDFSAPNSVNDDVKIKPNIHGYKLDHLSWAREFATIVFYSFVGVQSKGSYNLAVKPNCTNVFERPGVCKKFKHTDADVQAVINPYQKPQLLLMDLIDLLSMRGEWVMDHFAKTGTTIVSALKRDQNVIDVECDPLQVKFIEQQVTALKELPDEFQEVGMKSMALDLHFFDASGEPQPPIGSEKVGEIIDLVDFEPNNVEVEEQASDTPLQITSMGERQGMRRKKIFPFKHSF